MTATASTKTASTKTAKTTSTKAASTLPVGRVCWVGLKTPDVEASERFFAGVLGWAFQTAPMGGQDSRVFAGPDGAVGHITPATGPSSFVGAIVVDDVAATARRVKAAGGEVKGDIATMPGIGAMVEVDDGQGARLSLFQPETPAGAEVNRGPGGLLWHELQASNVEASVSFLTAVFGYGVAVMPMPTGPYHVMTRTFDGEEQQLTGVMGAMDPQAASAWVPYFHVVDVDAARARAIADGAVAFGEADDIPGIGRMANLLDPRGARFALMTPSTPSTPSM